MINISNTRTSFDVGLSKGAEEYEVLFATAIVNPMGPTFTIYYFDRSSPDEASQLYRVMIHPTSESFQVSAQLSWDSDLCIINQIDLFSDFFNGSMPTLFMNGRILNDHEFDKVLSLFIDSSNDSYRTFNYLEEFEGNPVQRISAEMKDSFKSTLDSQKPQEIGQINTSTFIHMLKKEENVTAEIKALFMAYMGSTRNAIPEGMVRIDFKTFLDIFSHVAAQCHVQIN